ncbi:hypothetical protein DE146DRAFT_662282 [Phaeosphaeria sp. MPI-PUGE-AT-0046c]|nr:hypothetical protein DE146DRAFT_662282 [Phaeosphaeria sp. MPI-PUGE-AT-0046c]
MAHQPNFQPKQPVRSDTVGSQNSQSSGQLSPPMSPISPSRATSDFFGAITARVRGRSRSREAGQRSKSPMVSPPRQISHTDTSSAQPQHTRQTSTTSAPTRPPLQPANRRSTGGSDAWRGRHSNEWLFGGWSATETAKDLLNRRTK